MAKSARVKVRKEWLQKIINEEFVKLQNEAVDHEGVKTVVTSASKLLKVAETFKETANTAMTNALTPQLDQLISTLEAMIETPGSYVDQPKVEPKTIKLRQILDNE